MTYIIVSFETRKPELTPTDFAEYYDNVHVPIIKESMGPSFPLSHARYYLKRQSDDPKNSNSTVPLVFMGTAGDFDYDAMVIMTFESEAKFLEFQTKFADPAIGGKIGESAQRFIVQSKLRVLGLDNPHVTTA